MDVTIFSIPRQPGEPHANECRRCGGHKSKREQLCEQCRSNSVEWFIYIPEEGDWRIPFGGTNAAEARLAYLRWAGRKRLPAGSKIWSREVEWSLVVDPDDEAEAIEDALRRHSIEYSVGAVGGGVTSYVLADEKTAREAFDILAWLGLAGNVEVRSASLGGVLPERAVE